MSKNEAAQNQHYVPKFILRHFLSNERKEQVTVFQKSTGKQFSTNIKNVMAERRFNEFRIDDQYYASFEQSVCRVEDAVLPAYDALVERGFLSQEPDERAMLGVFFAFQMLRTRAYRDGMSSVFGQLRTRLSDWGVPPDNLHKLDDLNEDDAKKSHLLSIEKSIKDFSNIIANKDLILMEAPKGRSFYLADNPVALHNDNPRKGFRGNIGLSVPGIQIYVPLTSKYMLAAWCPSILGKMADAAVAGRADEKRLRSTIMLSPKPMDYVARAKFESEMVEMDKSISRTENFMKNAQAGKPVLVTGENMDFYNSIQVQNAREFIACQRGDFNLAKRVVAEHGANSGGFRIQVG
jgi:hypothetical protein